MFGLLNCSLWGYILATFILTQITIAGVTIYLHRSQAHRALTLHPIVSHFFRFWLWMTTGMVTSEWVAVHRKHHAATEVAGDPHSPVLLGIRRVLWRGVALYRAATKDKEMIKKYSHGTPNDWMERNIYGRFSSLGVFLMLIVDLCLFGAPGLLMWSIQMLWIPFWAAGVINGIGHYWGYRNFECDDASTNMIPWGIWIGGEELHNNHHTFASSAKFSVKWWEFDIGWFYIRCLSLLGLARVKKLPPKLKSDKQKLNIDIDTVRAVVGNRFQVMSQYYKRVIQPVLQQEKQQLKHLMVNQDKLLLTNAGALLRRREALLSPHAMLKLNRLLERFDTLRIVYQYRQSLQQVWLKAATSQKELIEALQLWCKQAEASGIEALYQFSAHLRTYVASVKTA